MQRLALVCLMLLIAGAAPVALAQGYPARPIRIVVPYPPGGTSDILARALAEKLTGSVEELVARAKAKPGKLNFAISGVGGAPHLAGVEFALRTGVLWEYIPYKGGSQAIADVAGGQADATLNGMLATYPLVKGGKLRILAVSSGHRMSAIAEVPTIAESGLPGFETGSWQGVVAPAGTPRDVVQRLNAEIARIVGTPDMRDNLARQGAEVRTNTPDEFAAFIRAEMARWAKVVKDANVKVE